MEVVICLYWKSPAEHRGSNWEFQILGEHLKAASGALVVPGGVIENHSNSLFENAFIFYNLRLEEG